MAYVYPKTKEGVEYAKLLGLFLHRGNFKNGMFFTPPSRSFPKHVQDFWSPKDEPATEEQFIAAAKAHMAEHGWRLKPVWVANVLHGTKDAEKRVAELTRPPRGPGSVPKV